MVIPAYNEATRMDTSEVNGFLARTPSANLLFVNDGSTDATAEVLDKLAMRWQGRIEVLHLQQNGGKAEAVRQGMLKASESGDRLVGYWDADWATPLDASAQFIACMERRPQTDFVMGARVALLGRKIDRKPHRHYLGRIAATVASLVLGIPVYDTQCGAKLLKPELAQTLFREPFRSKWTFDVELIARYLKLTGSTEGLFELPLDAWTDVGDSKVKPVDFVRSFGEMARVYRNYRLPKRYHLAFDVITAPFVRYAGAGAIGTAAHYATLILAVELLSVDPTISSVFGALIGALTNYGLSYHFVFSSLAPHRRTLPRFMFVAGIGVVVNGAVVHYGVSTLQIYYLLAQLGATLTVLALGFILNRFWTFATHENG